MFFQKTFFQIMDYVNLISLNTVRKYIYVYRYLHLCQVLDRHLSDLNLHLFGDLHLFCISRQIHNKIPSVVDEIYKKIFQERKGIIPTRRRICVSREFIFKDKTYNLNKKKHAPIEIIKIHT